MVVIQFIFILCLLTALGLFCAWEQARVTELGYRAEQFRFERECLLRRQRELLCEMSSLSSPQRIAGEVKRMGIALIEAERLIQVRVADGPTHTGVSHSQIEIGPKSRPSVGAGALRCTR